MANPVITTLTNYIQQERLPLISKAVLGAKSIKMFSKQTGIKTSAAINLLTTDVQFQDGKVCGFQDAGTQELSQRVLTTGVIKVNLEYCKNKMLDKWMQYEISIKVGDERLPFEQEFVEDVNKDIQAKLEKAVWQGDTTSGDENLKWFDGLLKIATNDVSVNKVTITGTSAYDDIMAVYAAIPEQVLDNAVIFVGADVYRKFGTELVNKNLFHYDGAYSNGEVYIPGTSTRVVKVNGLNGTDKIFAADPNRVYFGCDMVDDAEEYDFWYSKDSDSYRLNIRFNAGVQYPFSNEVVLGAKA